MFYNYHQNNSGGSFVIDKDVSVNVIIEADSPEEADQKAKDIGIYFDGCDKGFDCPCCGDRWYPAYGKGDELPSIYGKPIQEYADSERIAWEGNAPCAYVYYADGRKQAITGRKAKETAK